MGMMETTPPAITRFHFVSYLPCKAARPTGRVINASLLVTIKGHKNEFQDDINANTQRVAIAGFAKGAIILEKTVTTQL